MLGTRAEMGFTTLAGEPTTRAEQAVIDEVLRLEQVFTVFDDSSALHELRRTGRTANVELQTVADIATWWRNATGGAFHPAVHSLTVLWDQAETVGVAPRAEVIDAVVRRLQTSNDAAGLDLNAIAKGWIADRALELALQTAPDVCGGWLTLGGDVVHRGNGSVSVGIEDPGRPYDNVAPMASIDVSNEALATSGVARRWWTIGDQRWPKVLDPRTGYPVDHVASATVVAPDAATADVLATIAMIVSADELQRLAMQVGAECFLVAADGTVTSTSGRFRSS